MKKLMLMAFLCLNLARAYSQSADTLNEVVISTNRIPTTFSRSTQTVTIIDSMALRAAPVTTVNELLQYIAGVDIRSRGPLGLQSDITMRGGSFDQVLVMIDGVKVSDPQTGHHNLNLPISLGDIERIEVLKGAGARVYGQNAFSGAINIITKRPKNSMVTFQGNYGQYNYLNGNASATYVNKQVRQRISGGYSSSDGYRLNTDFNNYNVLYTADIKAQDAAISFTGGLNEKAFGANGFYSDRFPWQWEHTRTLFMSAALQAGRKNIFNSQVYTRRHYDEFLLKRDTPSFYRNLHITDIQGMAANYNINWQAGITAIGAEVRNEDINSNSLGNSGRQNIGLTIEHSLMLAHKLKIEPGLYINWTNVAKFQLFPGINLGYQLNNNLNLYASANKSFRLPTFTELYYKDPANVGNPNLTPESAWTYEMGARYGKKALGSYLAVFSRNGFQMIDWLKLDGVYYARNIQQVQTNGVEAEVSYSPFLINANSVIKRLDLQYTYLNSNATYDATQSKYVLDYLTHQAIAGIHYRIYKKLTHVVRCRYEVRKIYDPYLLIDSRLSWDATKFMIYIQGNNLLDTKYYEVGKVLMPGRWVIGGITLNLNLK